MNATELIDALALPESSRVDQRVPKKTLAEHAAGKAASRRLIQDGIEAMRWVAALKPSNCGVPAYADATREYLEIAVLDVQLRPTAKATRLLPFAHRAIPYPTFMVVSQEGSVLLSLAHKRWSQAEKGRVVVDGEIVVLPLDTEASDDARGPFLEAIALVKQPRATLYDLYQGWLDTALSMQAAALLGGFRPPRSREHAAERADALRECERLESEMASIRTAAAREKQLPRRVELNLQLQRLADAHTEARARL